MTESTRNLVYLLLDMIDALERSSRGNSALFSQDSERTSEAKNELLALLGSSKPQSKAAKGASTKVELIGFLPSALIDRTKFPSNSDVVRLANQSLGLQMPRWEKKKRDELIGTLISAIAQREERELGMFLEAWKKFVGSESIAQTRSQKKNYVDTWLDFFEQYQQEK